jgi:Recombination endonuclease VII
MCENIKPISEYGRGEKLHGTQTYCRSCISVRHKHNKLVRAGLAEPVPTIKQKRLAEYEASGQKECNSCHEVKPLDDFLGRVRWGRPSKSGKCSACRQRQNKDTHARIYRERGDEITVRNLNSKYNIDVVELWHECDGECQICGEKMVFFRQPGPSRKKANVDHDHACCPIRCGSCGECVRSLPCNECNQMLGNARDNSKRLRAAADYLDRWFSRND